MNWTDEGALYSQIALFLREDLGRGDLTSQAILARNTRARGRFVAGETMIVAGLEAAEEVFLTLDSQQQLEAFVADGEQIEAGKLIARVVGFADVLLAGERVALNLIQHLSGVATLTNQFVQAVAGTHTQIVDSREATPGLRMLERYAVELGGGQNSRFGLDDGVVVSSNHTTIIGGVGKAVRQAKESLGYLHKITVQVTSESEMKEAVDAGADIVVLEGFALEQLAQLVKSGREISSLVRFECSGSINLENVRAYADAGVDFIRVESLTSSAPAKNITFKVQPF